MFQPIEFAEKFINQTNESIFLTGKAGTGKTTFLRAIVQSTFKKTVIVAPTGIAALNAGGVTIHSFFQLPFSGFIPEFGDAMLIEGTTKFETKKTLLRHFRLNSKRKKLMRSIDLLIIDEVSMLRADLLDAIDWTLRNVRGNNDPFGGVQVLFIGDLFQLPPVIKNEEWATLNRYYAGVHFFNAHVIQERPPLYIELTTIFRQQNATFIEILNNLRNNHLTETDIAVLNEHVNPNFSPKPDEGYITLTTHNYKADEMNSAELKKIQGKSHIFKAEIQGDFPKHIYPLDTDLELKIGTQIMFIKNDLSAEKRFYNGKMAIITEIDVDEISVECIEDNLSLKLDKYEWENIQFETDENTGEIDEKVIGTFVQYPVKLAWAITVHKSQGLTFEKAILDVSQVFAAGQAYVALSRLRSLDGLILLNPMRLNGLKTDKQIVQYASQIELMDRLPNQLEGATNRYLHTLLQSTFDWVVIASKWSSHLTTYKEQSSKTEKAKNHSWMTHQTQQLQQTLEPARKFRLQLQNLFAQQRPDSKQIIVRLDAAFSYFFPILDSIYYSLLKKIAELNRIKKTKSYVDELMELEEDLLSMILDLQKSILVSRKIILGESIKKQDVLNSEISNYKQSRINKLKLESSVSADIFQEKTNLDTSVFETKKSRKKVSETKEKKPSTYEQTLELIESGKSIQEIASLRQFTVTTIYNHIEKLIIQEKLVLESFVSAEKIDYMKKTIQLDKKLSLGELKEQVGDAVSWEELKLFRASYGA